MEANGSEKRRRGRPTISPHPHPYSSAVSCMISPFLVFFSLSNMWEEEEEEDKSFRDLEGGGGRRKKNKKFAHIRPILFSKMAKKYTALLQRMLSSISFLFLDNRRSNTHYFFSQTDGKQLPRQPSNFEKNYIHRKHYAFPQNCSSSVLKNPPFPQLLPPPLALICSIPIVLCSSPPLLLPLIHSHYLL